MQANVVHSLTGIINGTTNYILTRMTREGLGFDEVLREAQALGYAEKDPTADVDGFDAAYKLSILASLAFHTKVPLEKVYREDFGGKLTDRKKINEYFTALFGEYSGYVQQYLFYAKRANL